MEEGPFTRAERERFEQELDERQRAAALHEAASFAKDSAIYADRTPEAVVVRAEVYFAFLKGGVSGKASD